MTIDELIDAEMQRQLELWGEQNHPNGTDARNALRAEITQQHNDLAATEGTLTWLDILLEEIWEASAETDPVKLGVELVQCAAVIKSWLAALDRQDKAAKA